MPFFQVVDELTSNPKIQSLLDGMNGDIEGIAAVGLWTAAGSRVQQSLSDGVISLKMCVSVILNPSVVQTLAARLVEVGLWHAPGHDCPRCAQPPEGSWIFHDWFDLRYEKGSQVKVTRGKRAELKDRKVTASVWARDRIGEVLKGGDMVAPCRYCGTEVRKLSRSEWNYDHVNPSLYIGAENIVIACVECNKKKAQRTPAEAGMTLHRPGWKPGQVDWPSSPKAAQDSDIRVEVVEAVSAQERPTDMTVSGSVDDCLSDVDSYIRADMWDRAVDGGAQFGGCSGETVSMRERPTGTSVSGSVDAYSPGVDSPGSAELNAHTNPASELRKGLRQKCGNSELAAAAQKQVSTRARAGQGRAGQGNTFKGKDGIGQGSDWDSPPQGAVPVVTARKKRRRRKKSKSQVASSLPTPVGSAGVAPDVPLGGRFGSPWFNWHGRPPVDDDAQCPEHGVDVPCRFCLEDEE